MGGLLMYGMKNAQALKDAATTSGVTIKTTEFKKQICGLLARTAILANPAMSDAQAKVFAEKMYQDQLEGKSDTGSYPKK